jgi:hypothetical protein
MNGINCSYQGLRTFTNPFFVLIYSYNFPMGIGVKCHMTFFSQMLYWLIVDISNLMIIISQVIE